MDHVIGVARGGRGRIRFTPAPGPAGKRTIVAFVEQNGIPRDQITVATFTYRPLKLARPAHLRVKRKGSRLLVSFGAVRGADLYNVSVQRCVSGTSCNQGTWSSIISSGTVGGVASQLYCFGMMLISEFSASFQSITTPE